MEPDLKVRKPIVLAVDDYPANIVALEAVLSRDYHLEIATSGQEALAILQKKRDFDVILMDVQMPGMDGFKTASEIKKIPGVQDIPIIFVTAVYKEDPFVKKGYEAGGVDYFSKPFDPEILKMKIDVYSSFRQRSEVLRERERQVQETEELLRVGRKLSGVLESLPVGVLISDGEGRICQVNTQASEICRPGLLPNSSDFSKMLGWWDSNGGIIKDHRGPLYRVLHSGVACQNEEIEIECNSGMTKRILCSASPLLGLDGHMVGAVVILQDVTETKRIERDLEKRITRLVSLGVELEESF